MKTPAPNPPVIPAKPESLYRQSLIVAAVAALAAVLFRFPPEHYAFYPQCPIHQYTGLLCPGCGATRALSALLHGHLVAALHLNALALLLLPAVLLSARFNRGSAPVPRIFHAAAWSAVLLFTVVRNLP